MSKRWDVSQEQKARAVEGWVKIVENKDSSAAALDIASQSLLKAESQNQTDDRNDLEPTGNRIHIAAQRLGISINQIDDDAGRAIGGGSNSGERLQPASAQDRRTDNATRADGPKESR